jgi:hypothetical protein
LPLRSEKNTDPSLSWEAGWASMKEWTPQMAEVVASASPFSQPESIWGWKVSGVLSAEGRKRGLQTAWAQSLTHLEILDPPRCKVWVRVR